MPVELPGDFDEDLQYQMVSKAGSDWPDLFATKRGSDWADQWAEIQQSLDSGWADQSTGDKADALIELVRPSAPAW